MTIYLFSGSEKKQRYKISHINDFVKNYLISEFWKLNSYAGLCIRLNELSEALKILCNTVIQAFIPKECTKQFSLFDSLPIFTCGVKRTRKVAKKF